MSAETSPVLSVVVPCFREERRLPGTLARLEEFLGARGEAYELLIVDDGSDDGTVELARKYACGRPEVRVIASQPNRGKGYAVRRGALEARGERVLFSDADLSTPIEELERFLRSLEQGFDVAIGSRALAGSDLRVRQPWWRERAGRTMNFLIRILSGLPYADTQCGFKLFTREAARDLFGQATVDRWMFDVELLVLARKLGYRVAELPVTWVNSSESRVRLSHAPGIFRELFHIRWHWLRHSPSRRAADEAGAAAQPGS
jgi:dolichyl-phosphate beta-glucosyltransferase